MPCPCSKGALILSPHVPCHCPFTCHICPCPHTLRRASPLPSYTHMCSPLPQHVICPSASILLPHLPYHCPTCALLLCLYVVPRPCPHMGAIFASIRAPPLHHTCSTLAPLHVPQLRPHTLCPCLHKRPALASSRALPLSYTCLALARPPHVP